MAQPYVWVCRLHLLTAAVLTPTDAALGQSVVSNPEVPDHLSQTINVESGLNDGLVLPFVLLGAVLASSVGARRPMVWRWRPPPRLCSGPLAGIAVGWVAAKGDGLAQNRDLMQEAAGAVVFLVTAFAAYGFAVAIHGNGFIAAFVAGMVFGNTYRHDIHFISEFMEGLANFDDGGVSGVRCVSAARRIGARRAKYDHSCVGLPHAGPCLANLRFSDKKRATRA